MAVVYWLHFIAPLMYVNEEDKFMAELLFWITLDRTVAPNKVTHDSK